MIDKPIEVLLVEDNPTDSMLIEESLKQAQAESFTVTIAQSLSQAFERLATSHCDAVLLDLGLPDCSGLDTFIEFHTHFPRMPVMVLTGLDDETIAISALQAGAQDYLIKGSVGSQELARGLRYAIERRHFEDRILELNAALERRVAERTAELEAVNKDLEAFSSLVSHEIRNPLQIIQGFARLLYLDYGDRLGEEGKHYAQVIHGRSQQIAHLIEDLMDLSLMGHMTLKKKWIDMTAMVKEIISEFEESEQIKSTRVTIEPLPPALADAVALRHVWMNLISNAIKYSRKAEQPTVCIRALDEENEYVFVVQDNGAGFDMKDAGELFSVFHRLHDKKDFEGTGLGLALVQRVISRHGGRAWAEALPGDGATFYFSLPKKDHLSAPSGQNPDTGQ